MDDLQEMIEIEQLQVLSAHTSDVNCCDFSGREVLATASNDKTVRVWWWRGTDGFVEAPFSPLGVKHQYGMFHVCFSPYGTMIATGCLDGTTALWDAKTGEKLFSFIQPSGAGVRVCHFSANSAMLVTGGDDNCVCLWDVGSHSLIRTFNEHEGTIFAVAFTPDSMCLVTTCSEGVLKLWDASCGHGKCLVTIKDGHDLGVSSCDFSPTHGMDDSSRSLITQTFLLATCGNDSLIRLWDVTVGMKYSIECQKSLVGHGAAVMCVRFAPGGIFLASAAGDKLVRIWDVESGRCLHILEGHTRYVTSCAFSSDRRFLATGSNDKNVVVWDLRDKCQSSGSKGRPWLHSGKISPARRDMTPWRIYEKRSHQQMADGSNETMLLQTLRGHTSDVNSCAFLGRDLLATASSDKLIHVWQLNPGNGLEKVEFSPLDKHSYGVHCVTFSPSGTILASASTDASVILWNAKTGKKIASLPQPNGSGVRVCSFSPNSAFIISGGDDNSACLWDVKKRELIQILCEHEGTVFAATFTPDSSYVVTTCSQGLLKLWEVGPEVTQSLATREDAHDLGVMSCDFSPVKGMKECSGIRRFLLATGGSDSFVRLWYVMGKPTCKIELWRALEGHSGSVMCVRFAPNGRLLASASGDKTVCLWDTISAQRLRVLEGHTRYVTTCAFSGDSQLLATGSNDKRVLIWELHLSNSHGSAHLKTFQSQISDWAVDDVERWLTRTGFLELVQAFKINGICGKDLIHLTNETLENLIGINSAEVRKRILDQISWLQWGRQEYQKAVDEDGIPQDFFCPITHEIMIHPVLCADGYTYERAAISEWFLSGKSRSPMTNLKLPHTSLTTNLSLQNVIKQYIQDEGIEEDG